MDNFRIVGTHHLMSKEEIYNIIKKESPEIIGVELCEERHKTMVMPLLDNYLDEKPKEKPKEDNSLIGKISNKIKEKADKEGKEYGSDMINACLYAKENNLILEFVDMDISKTKELMEKIPKEESEGFMKELLEFETKNLTEVTENIDVNKTLREMKARYPIAFEFLINMRNIVILNNLLKLERKHPDKKILIFLGKGHEKIIEDAIK